jgi:hypothetical protein
LPPNTAHIATDHGRPFPHCLGDRQAEALAYGLLQHDGRASLQRVHQVWIIGRENDNALVKRGVDGLENDSALGIVDRIVASTCAAALRNASITPTGSFQRSKRETCTTSGRMVAALGIALAYGVALWRRRHRIPARSKAPGTWIGLAR